MTETAVRVNTGIQRTLRSSPREQQELEQDEEVALEKAEEKLMGEEDEEIESCDEEGKPVVDTEKLERRMMTVALVKSVVETTGNASDDKPAEEGDADADKKHTYGLRKRNSKSNRDSSDDEEQPQPRRRKTQPLKKRSVATALPAPPALAKRPKKVGNSSSAAKAENGPMRIQSTQQVPNPLLQQVNSSPPAQARAAAASLHPVPCPLPESESIEDCRPDAAHSAPMTMKANDTGAGRRGRIFSIDIDRK